MPTADLPLLTCRLSGGDVPPDGAVAWAAEVGPAGRAGQARRAGRSAAAERPGVRWRDLGSVACSALGAALGALGADGLAMVPLNIGALQAILFIRWIQGLAVPP